MCPLIGDRVYRTVIVEVDGKFDIIKDEYD